jgi:hypothetical protein
MSKGLTDLFSEQRWLRSWELFSATTIAIIVAKKLTVAVCRIRCSAVAAQSEDWAVASAQSSLATPATPQPYQQER